MSGFPQDPNRSNPMPGNQTPYAQSPYTPPPMGAPMHGGNHHGHQTGDGTGGVIPYKNPMALIAYYCAVFSLLPCIGIPIGLVAFILGILGLMAVKKNPVIKGTAHAWIGIIGGFLIPVLQIGVVVAFSMFSGVR